MGTDLWETAPTISSGKLSTRTVSAAATTQNRAGLVVDIPLRESLVHLSQTLVGNVSHFEAEFAARSSL